MVRAAQHTLRRGRRRHLGGDAAALGYHRIHRNIRLVADADFRQGVFHVVLPAQRRSLRILHLSRPVHHVHVLRGGPNPDVPSYRRLGQRPQGVCSNEADAYAYGRLGTAADRYPRNIFRVGRHDNEHPRDSAGRLHPRRAAAYMVPAGIRRLRRAGRALPLPHMEPRRPRLCPTPAC